MPQIFGQLSVARETLTPNLKGSRRGTAKRLKMLLGTIAAVALVLVAVAVYFQPFAKPPKQSNTDKNDLNELEMLMQEGSSADLAREARRVGEGFAGLPLPEKVATLKQQLEITNRLLQMDDATDRELQDGIINKINALAVLTTLNYKHDLKENWVENELIRYASQHLDHKDETVEVQARLALAFAYVQTYLVDPSEENFKRMLDCFIESAPVVSQDGSTSERFLTAVRLVRRNDNEEHTRMVFEPVGDLLKKSPDGNVWLKGARLKDLLVFGAMNFAELEFKVSIGDQQSIDTAYEMIEKIASAEEISPYAVRRCLRLAETLERIGQEIDIQAIVERFRAREWDHEFGNRMAENLLDGHAKRRQILGKKMELSGIDLNGKPVDFSDFKDHRVVVVFVSFNDKYVMDGLGVLANLGYLKEQGIRFVCCEAIPKYDPATGLLITDQIKVAKPMLPAAQLIPFSGAEDIVQQHPVITTPYAIILDKDHKVVRINVNLDTVRSELEGMLGG